MGVGGLSGGAAESTWAVVGCVPGGGGIAEDALEVVGCRAWLSGGAAEGSWARHRILFTTRQLQGGCAGSMGIVLLLHRPGQILAMVMVTKVGPIPRTSGLAQCYFVHLFGSLQEPKPFPLQETVPSSFLKYSLAVPLICFRGRLINAKKL